MRRIACFCAVSVLLTVAAFPGHAALPTAPVSFGTVKPTPSGVVNTKYQDGNDGAAAIPLIMGTCPPISLLTTDTQSYNLRTLCNLNEPGSPLAAISILSGTLPSGCVVEDIAGSDGINDGITCTTPTAGSGSLVARATRSGATADSQPFTILVTAAGTDTTDPAIPVGLAVADGGDGFGTVSWYPSSDASVSGIATGVVDYQVKVDGVVVKTVDAPSANAQAPLTETLIGANDGKAHSQSGASHTLTFAGTGMGSTTDQALLWGVSVTGDFRAITRLSAYSATSGTGGSAGIQARTSDAVGAQYLFARWRDLDDKCNQRYRGAVDAAAANGALSAVTYTPGSLWIMLERSGDAWTTSCSADAVTFTQTSSITIALGATVIVGPAITSGSATNTATATFAEFNIHQAPRVSTGVSGSGGVFSVNASDGTNRSDDSATVTQTITGTPPSSGGITVPPATHTVCYSGCDYTPSDLATIAISQRVPGDVLELRTAVAFAHETWPVRAVCSGTNGTANDPIWMTVRDGDHITLATATSAAGDEGILDWNCSYWNIVGDTDGGTDGLVISDPTKHRTDRNCMHFSKITGSKCYPGVRRALHLRGGTGVAFVGLEVNGADNYVSSRIADEASYILFKNARIGSAGSNACDGCANATAIADGVINTGTAEGAGTFSSGDSDSSEAMDFCASHSIFEDVYLHHSGHVPAQPCGPYQVWRRVTGDMNWRDNSDYGTYYTGNHALVSKTTSGRAMNGNWSTTLFGPLYENNLLINAGTEPEHQEWIETAQLEGYNLIVRGSYIVQSTASSGQWFGMMAAHIQSPNCGMTKLQSYDPAYVYNAHIKIYNNTIWGGSIHPAQPAVYQFTSGNRSDALGLAMTAEECSDNLLINNLFQGLTQNRRSGKRSAGASISSKWAQVAGFAPIGSYSGWPNNWKGTKILGNLWSKHPTDPPSDTWFKFSFNTSGGGDLVLTNGVDANGDWDCADAGDSGTWPANFCGNKIQSAVWANGATSPLSGSPSMSATPAAATLAADVRPALTLRGTAGDPGVGDAWPITRVATADSGTGTTLVLDDARWIYDGWDNDEYTWGGIHQEYPDCIAVGATLAATAASATVVAVASATDTNYATGTVTLASSVTRVDGAPVWPATRNSNGSCGAVWDNRGAAQ